MRRLQLRLYHSGRLDGDISQDSPQKQYRCCRIRSLIAATVDSDARGRSTAEPSSKDDDFGTLCILRRAGLGVSLQAGLVQENIKVRRVDRPELQASEWVALERVARGLVFHGGDSGSREKVRVFQRQSTPPDGAHVFRRC
jgi:hypothetical protein